MNRIEKDLSEARRSSLKVLGVPFSGVLLLVGSCGVPYFDFNSPSCEDGVKNGTETGVDCGGSCDSCDAVGCTEGDECESGACEQSECVEANCSDGQRDTSESDVDCGGAVCPKCELGRSCDRDSDCVDGECHERRCQALHCTDSTTNEEETDVDCGGAECPKCGVNQRCLVDSDCRSGLCEGEFCAPASCDDRVVNGGETDVDCGGANCAPCGVGDACKSSEDCVTGICEAAQCVSDDANAGVAGAGGEAGASGVSGSAGDGGSDGQAGAGDSGGTGQSSGGAPGSGGASPEAGAAGQGAESGQGGAGGEGGMDPVVGDLALGQPAAASTNFQDEPPESANDGDTATRWCASGPEVEQWWVVDLGAPFELTGLQILWELEDTEYDYVVEVSDDNSTFTTALDLSENPVTSALQTWELTATARYLRLRVVGLPGSVWACVYDVQVLGY